MAGVLCVRAVSVSRATKHEVNIVDYRRETLTLLQWRCVSPLNSRKETHVLDPYD
jgi:hypothetical protein